MSLALQFMQEADDNDAESLEAYYWLQLVEIIRRDFVGAHSRYMLKYF